MKDNDDKSEQRTNPPQRDDEHETETETGGTDSGTFDVLEVVEMRISGRTEQEQKEREKATKKAEYISLLMDALETQEAETGAGGGGEGDTIRQADNEEEEEDDDDDLMKVVQERANGKIHQRMEKEKGKLKTASFTTNAGTQERDSVQNTNAVGESPVNNTDSVEEDEASRNPTDLVEIRPPTTMSTHGAFAVGGSSTTEEEPHVTHGAFAVGGSATTTEEEPQVIGSSIENLNYGNSSNSVSGLSEAFQVIDEEIAGVATPFDEAAMNRKSRRKEKIFGLLICVILIVAALAFVAGTFFERSTATTTEKDPNEIVESPPPTDGSPSMSPSAAPTGAMDLLLQELPSYTLESLKSMSTPQWKAKDWLENHPNLNGIQEHKKKQSFALVTFYYAMGGPTWPQIIQDNWLQYETDECYWFSSEFGLFGDAGKYEEDLAYNITPCNANHEFQSLTLAELDFDTKQNAAYIPPEISLLTSLVVLALPSLGINASLADCFLPSHVYQMTNLTVFSLAGNSLTGSIPSELGGLFNLQWLELGTNRLTGPIPSQLGLLTNMAILRLPGNALNGAIPTELGASMSSVRMVDLNRDTLTGPLPSELGLMRHATKLNLNVNRLSGRVPTQIGLMTKMVDLQLARPGLLVGTIPTELFLMSNLEVLYLLGTNLHGPIPTQVGLATALKALALFQNRLTGTIPSQVGSLFRISTLSLLGNALTGRVPSEIGLMTNLEQLLLMNNHLSGEIPKQLAMISTLFSISLRDNNFSGSIPHQFGQLATNGSLAALVLNSNAFSGTISDHICSLGVLPPKGGRVGLSFDCNDQLCGCCWCPCPGSHNKTSNCYDPALEDSKWPGAFPTPINSTNSITINLVTDDYPEETTVEWSKVSQSEKGETFWKTLDSFSPQPNNTMLSHTMATASSSAYRLRLLDSSGDGTCCSHGFGWFTLTNSTPSQDHPSGTVVWQTSGEVLKTSMVVFLTVNIHGRVEWADCIPVDLD